MKRKTGINIEREKALRVEFKWICLFDNLINEWLRDLILNGYNLNN